MLESVMILLFEFLGTAFLTCLYMASTSGLGGGYIGFFVGTFILLIFSARISGSHYNPGVTLAFMLRKDTGRFSRWLGLAYILFQVAGAICGAFLAWFVFASKSYLGVFNNNLVFQAMTQETLGTFIIVFMYLSQTEEKTKLSNDPAITTGIIAASYLMSIVLGYGGGNFGAYTMSSNNFAISLAQITMMTFDGDIGVTNYQWIYLTFNWLGALIAVFSYECIFRRAAEQVEESEEFEEETRGEPLINE